MNILLTNNAISVLALGIGVQDTLVQVHAGDGGLFPSLQPGQYFPVTLVTADREIEIVHVTARSGDTLTVVRGQEGTAQRPFPAGSVVELRLTAGLMNALLDGMRGANAAIDALGTAAYADIGSKPEQLPRNQDLPALGSAAFEEVGSGDLELPTASMVRQLIAQAIASAQAELLAKDVGLVVYRSGGFAAADEVAAYGQLLNRDDYPELWAYAQGSSNLVGSDAEWAANQGMYSPGDGATTFRVPDLRGEFLRGWDAGRGVDSGRAFGSSQLDQMQRITGYAIGDRLTGGVGSESQYYAEEGALAWRMDDTRSRGQSGTGGESAGLVFDSAYSPNARTSATTSGETRPRNIAYLPCIKTGRLTK